MLLDFALAQLSLLEKISHAGSRRSLLKLKKSGQLAGKMLAPCRCHFLLRGDRFGDDDEQFFQLRLR